MQISSCTVCTFLASIGVCLLVSFLWTVFLPLFLTGSLKKLTKKFNSSGDSWAIVTGTTSGIGLAFVHTLHKLGFNVLMISRNESAMKEIQKELMGQQNKIEYLVIDLSDFNKNGIDKVKIFIASHNVTLLINNAGLSNEYPKLLTEYTTGEAEGILAVNCASLVSLTQLVLPSMIASKCGCVINMSSLFGSIGGPLVSVYSGSKNFVDAFSLSLNEELQGTGVMAFCAIPGFVVSKMSKLRRTSLTVISAEACVNTILRQVAGGTLYYVCPHWTHSAIQWFMLTVLPQCIRLKLLARINRATNKAALRKRESVK
jgi:17beta-estradiol 17-dehydrogenase / very-long-chain 3-oxoacyl-CoA reductase